MEAQNSKVVEIPSHNCAETTTKTSARDFSPEYRLRVVQKFLIYGEKKSTARHFRMSARLVQDIIDFTKVETSVPMTGGRRDFYPVRELVRRTA